MDNFLLARTKAAMPKGVKQQQSVKTEQQIVHPAFGRITCLNMIVVVLNGYKELFLHKYITLCSY